MNKKQKFVMIFLAYHFVDKAFLAFDYVKRGKEIDKLNKQVDSSVQLVAAMVPLLPKEVRDTVVTEFKFASIVNANK